MEQTAAGRIETEGTMQTSEKPFGPVAAAFLAAGIGAVILGLLTTLAEANEDVKSALEWSKSVGPLTGKTLLASACFLISWFILYFVLREKNPAPTRIFVWTGILIGIGLLLTFPTLFQAFAPEE